MTSRRGFCRLDKSSSAWGPQTVLWVGGTIGIVAWLVVIVLLIAGLGWFAFAIAACVAVLLAERVAAVRGSSRLDTIGASFAGFMVTSPLMVLVLLFALPGHWE